MLFLTILLIVGYTLQKEESSVPTEGCQGLGQPPKLYYENTLVNNSFSAIPSWAITQMDGLYKQVLSQMDEDYLGVTTAYGSWIFYGSSGRALLHLRVMEDNKTYHISMAEKYIEEALGSLPVDEDHFGYLKGNVGIFAVAAMVYSLKGDTETSDYYVDLVLETFTNVTNDDDSDYDEGLAGLIDIAPVLNTFFGSEVISSDDELRVGHLIFENGLQYFNKTTKALQFKNWEGESTVWWIGVGVGSGGSVYELLKRDDLMKNKTIRMYVQSTVEYFLTQQDSSGFVRSDYPKRVQWCHGSPGFIAVFIEAHRVFQDDKYLEAAKLAAEFTAEKGILGKGYQLGHGVSGNIYMVMTLYKYLLKIGDDQASLYLSKALSMLLQSLEIPELVDPEHWKSWDCVPGSLWISTQGGMVSLFYDLVKNQDHLEDISMPVFEIHV